MTAIKQYNQLKGI